MARRLLLLGLLLVLAALLGGLFTAVVMALATETSSLATAAERDERRRP